MAIGMPERTTKPLQLFSFTNASLYIPNEFLTCLVNLPEAKERVLRTHVIPMSVSMYMHSVSFSQLPDNSRVLCSVTIRSRIYLGIDVNGNTSIDSNGNVLASSASWVKVYLRVDVVDAIRWNCQNAIAVCHPTHQQRRTARTPICYHT